MFPCHVVMVSRMCDDGVQKRDGRRVPNSRCLQILFVVPVCILLAGSPAGLINFPLVCNKCGQFAEKLAALKRLKAQEHTDTVCGGLP